MEIINYDLLDDLSKLTTIPKNNLAKLSNVGQDIIASDIYSTLIGSKGDISAIGIGIGTLYVKVADDVQYKFVPSEAFEDEIRDVVSHRKDPLIRKVEESLVNRILNTYKDLL